MERLHKCSAAEELQEFYGTLFHVTSIESKALSITLFTQEM
jgi:hypothetical protein